MPIDGSGPGPAGALRDRLLRVMDRKDHWAWPFAELGPGVLADKIFTAAPEVLSRRLAAA